MGGQKKRKANPGVGVDFKKVKHKVGKKLPKAQNETDTSFKARSINMPNQTVNENKDGQATNFQNLTLKELVSQVTHYSEKTRKHALQGLSDLFQRHPKELTGHLGLVCGKLVCCMADSDDSVRTTLASVLRERVCPVVTPSQLRPFMPVIMAHLAGATTHLSLDVRNDALVFLDILMDHSPQVIAASFMLPCLSHFCDLISIGHRSRSLRGQSLKALIKVLKALCEFLNRAFPSRPASEVGAALQAKAQLIQPPATSAQQQPNHQPSFTTLFKRRCVWARRSVATQPPATASAAPAQQQPTASASAQKPPAHQKKDQQEPLLTVRSAAERLVTLLMECWSECSVSELSTAPDIESATALVLILSACSSLMDNVLLTQQTTQAGTETASPSIPPAVLDLLQHNLVPFFPVRMPTVKPSPLILEQLVKFNLGCAQLLISLLQILPHVAHTPPLWLETLVGFYDAVLRTGQVVPSSGVLSEAAVQGEATLDEQWKGAAGGASRNVVYMSVLAGVQAAALAVPDLVAGRLLSAVDAFSVSVPSKSGLRAACLNLQYKLLSESQSGAVHLEASWIASWLSSIPKLLWELGSSCPSTSLPALCMLHDAARFSAPQSTGPAQAQMDGQAGALGASLASLQPKLAPLWCVQLPPGSGSKSKAGKEPSQTGQLLAGPIPKLPEPLQELAVDTLAHLGPLDAALLSAVLKAVRHRLLSFHTSLRAVEVLMRLAVNMPPDACASTILSLLLTPPPETLVASPAQEQALSTWLTQQWQVVDVVLRMVRQALPASALLLLLTKHVQAAVKPVLDSTCLHSTAGMSGVRALHVYCTLRLCVLAGEEAQARMPGAVALEGWLRAALPQLLCWYAMQYGMSRGEETVADDGVKSGAGAAWQGKQGLGDHAWDHHPTHAAVQLCSAVPDLTLPVLDCAASRIQRLATSAAELSGDQYQGLLGACRALLTDAAVAKQCLSHGPRVQAAVEKLTAQTGLPSQVTANLSCGAVMQQVKMAAQSLLGTGARA